MSEEKETQVEYDDEFLIQHRAYQQNIILHFMDNIDKAVASGDKTEIDYWVQRFNMFKSGDNMFVDNNDNMEMI